MKNSKKIVALIMSTFMVCAIPAIVSGCKPDDSEKPPVVQPGETAPVKVKDGTDISVKVGENTKITVSEYLTANNNTVEVKSSNTAVASAELANGIITVTGKAKGTSNVTIKCGTITITFVVSVTEQTAQTSAPVFGDITASLNLKKNSSVEVTLAPKSGGDGFTFEYSVDELSATGATVSNDKLTYTTTVAENVEITVTVKLTNSKNPEQKYDDATFKVKITVTNEDAAKYTVTVDGTPVEVEADSEYTLPEYTGTPATGKEFAGWLIGSTPYAVGDKITVDENIEIVAKFVNKKYTVSVDGVDGEYEYGAEIVLSSDKYTQEIPTGKQLGGWTVDGGRVSVGSTVTVTGNHVITAIIEDVPEVDPVKVKDGEAMAFRLSETSKTVQLSDYITTNGNAVSVSSEDSGVVGVSESNGVITFTAVAAGKTNVKIVCKNIELTFPVTIKNAVPEFANGEINIDLGVSAMGIYQIQPVSGASTYQYSYTADNGATVNNENGTLSYTATAAGNVTITVSVTATDTATNEVETTSFTVTAKVTDTSAYRIINGSFDNWEVNKPVGWTVTEGYGSAQTASQYWENPVREFDNIGTYFGETSENNTGTLQTSEFIVGNSGWVTFQLGSGHTDAAIWVEIIDTETGTAIAKFRNFEWKDPDNALRLIPYKVNLSDYLGKSVVIKVVDNQGAGEMGFRTFYADEFNSWYDSEPMTTKADNGTTLTFVNLGAPVFSNATYSLDLADSNHLEITLPEMVYGINAACTYTTGTSGASISGNKLTFTPANSGSHEISVTGTTKYGSSTFKITVSAFSTGEYSIVNGDFEMGNLTGWTVLSGNVDLSGGTSNEVYHEWNEHMPYNKSGEYFCKNAGVANDGVAWSLKSSEFTLSGNGHISFKMGSHNAIIKVFLADGTQIYEYTCKTFFADDNKFPHFEQGANYITMLTHYADLSSYMGQKMYIVIGNNSTSGGDWNFAHFDDIITYYEAGEDLSVKQDNVPLTCTGKEVSHTDGETYSVNWIKAENEYNN